METIDKWTNKTEVDASCVNHFGTYVNKLMSQVVFLFSGAPQLVSDEMVKVIMPQVPKHTSKARNWDKDALFIALVTEYDIEPLNEILNDEVRSIFYSEEHDVEDMAEDLDYVSAYIMMYDEFDDDYKVVYGFNNKQQKVIIQKLKEVLYEYLDYEGIYTLPYVAESVIKLMDDVLHENKKEDLFRYLLIETYILFHDSQPSVTFTEEESGFPLVRMGV